MYSMYSLTSYWARKNIFFSKFDKIGTEKKNLRLMPLCIVLDVDLFSSRDFLLNRENNYERAGRTTKSHRKIEHEPFSLHHWRPRLLLANRYSHWLWLKVEGVALSIALSRNSLHIRMHFHSSFCMLEWFECVLLHIQWAHLMPLVFHVLVEKLYDNCV